MELNKIKTVCRDCIFATYKEKTQIGCDLNRIYKYKKRGVQVIPAYDEQREFYIINGAFCNAYRGPQWKKQNTGQNLIEVVKKEIKLAYSLFVSYNDEVDFITMIDCIKQLDIIPRCLYIINRSPDKHTDYMIKNYDNNWREINVLEVEWGDYLYVHQSIVSRKTKTLFYFHLSSHYIVHYNPNTLINNVNNYINEHLKEVLAIVYNNKIVGALTNLNRIYGRNFLEYINKDKVLNITEFE